MEGGAAEGGGTPSAPAGSGGPPGAATSAPDLATGEQRDAGASAPGSAQGDPAAGMDDSAAAAVAIAGAVEDCAAAVPAAEPLPPGSASGAAATGAAGATATGTAATDATAPGATATGAADTDAAATGAAGAGCAGSTLPAPAPAPTPDGPGAAVPAPPHLAQQPPQQAAPPEIMPPPLPPPQASPPPQAPPPPASGHVVDLRTMCHADLMRMAASHNKQHGVTKPYKAVHGIAARARLRPGADCVMPFTLGHVVHAAKRSEYARAWRLVIRRAEAAVAAAAAGAAEGGGAAAAGAAGVAAGGGDGPGSRVPAMQVPLSSQQLACRRSLATFLGRDPAEVVGLPLLAPGAPVLDFKQLLVEVGGAGSGLAGRGRLGWAGGPAAALCGRWVQALSAVVAVLVGGVGGSKGGCTAQDPVRWHICTGRTSTLCSLVCMVAGA